MLISNDWLVIELFIVLCLIDIKNVEICIIERFYFEILINYNIFMFVMC